MNSSSLIAQALQPFVDNGATAGAVALVGNKERILSLNAVGYSDIETKKPMRPDDLFWIASMTKPMTGTALMVLVDEGKVNVDDPVEKYLPEFKGQMVVAEKDDDHVLLRKPSHPILVREVLSHTSGLPFCSHAEHPTLDRLPLECAVRTYAMNPLIAEPGTVYGYANEGTNTAGRIVEAVSGMPYEQFMDERFFRPLKMKDTSFWPPEKDASRIVKTYRLATEGSPGLSEARLDQLALPYHDRARRFPMPAGGLFSTAADCFQFCRLILNHGEVDGHRYLSPGAVKQMTSKQTGDLVEAKYGFGWDAQDESTGHGGALNTNMTIFRNLDLITVFLVHHSGPHWPDAGGQNVAARFQEAAKKLAS